MLSLAVLVKTRLGFCSLLLFVCSHSGFSVLRCLFEIRSSLVFCCSLFVMSLACVSFLSSVRFCFIVFNSDEVAPFAIKNTVFCL